MRYESIYFFIVRNKNAAFLNKECQESKDKNVTKITPLSLHPRRLAGNA